MTSLDHLASCFCETVPAKKVRLLAAVEADDQKLLSKLSTFEPKPVLRAGYPSRPKLVDARQLPRRQLASTEGRGAFFHALCHIEFTAINLALDAVLRFCGMPKAYYRDWLQIAKEEASHFEILQTHLAGIGYRYGDFDAHDGMWQLARKNRT